MNAASNLFDFSDLASSDEQIAQDTRGKDLTRQKFDCIECGGTGLWQGGRTNQHGNPNCWTCAGRGFVMTDPRKLRADRIKRAEKKRDILADFWEENRELMAELHRAAEWSDFARSLHEQAATKPLSDRQLAAARSMVAKLIANRERREAKRAAERKERAVKIDLTPIRDMFEQAVLNGHKRPKYRAEGLEITRAPISGRNPGALYVKDDEQDYQGKILGIEFQPVRSALANVAERLRTIAADPRGAAVRYGQKTGTCSCCGRELTNAASVAAGIGPICAEKWGL